MNDNFMLQTGSPVYSPVINLMPDLRCILYVGSCFALMHLLLPAEHQSSPVAEMGDTLEFNEIYQEVKGSWVSIIYCHIFLQMDI